MVVEIDLSGLVFIGPTATALLLATANRLGDDGCVVRNVPPNNRLIYNYLLRSGFVRLFTEEDHPEPFSRLAPAGFHEISGIPFLQVTIWIQALRHTQLGSNRQAVSKEQPLPTVPGCGSGCARSAGVEGYAAGCRGPPAGMGCTRRRG
jgi:hypothetical protein